jgi:P-type Cu+ transporter
LSLNNSHPKIYKIEGMTCASCSQIIEDNVRKLQGLESIEVNFATEKAELHIEPNFNEELFIELLTKLGYRAIPINEFNEQNKELKEKSFFSIQLKQSFLCLIAGSILMALSMGPASHYFSHQANNLIHYFNSHFNFFCKGLS